MSHWVFNTHYASISRTGGGSNIQPSIQVRSTTTRTPIVKNENYLIIAPQSGNEQYQFTQFGKIIKISPPIPVELSGEQKEFNEIRKKQGRQPLPQEYIHAFELQPEGEIEEIKNLDDYTYSLLTIYRYLNPKRHFQQQVRAIPGEDYETITQEQIYIARTAFGNLINALPKDSKYDFVLYAIERFGTVEFKGIDFIVAYEFLWEYINENILSQGRFITNTYELLDQNLRETGIPLHRVGFGSSQETELLKSSILSSNDLFTKDDTIEVQAKYFFDLFNTIKNSSFSTVALQNISSDNPGEERLQQLFSNKTWPADMNA